MYRYSAYGEVEITGDTTIANINHIIYKSYYYDFESGLYYLKSRYYNPSLGIFIQPDKCDYLEFDNINGYNLYTYCNNNPVMHSDPEGHLSKFSKCLIGGTLIVGAIALTIGTAGLGGAIAGFLGTGIVASMAGGAIAGGIVGAATGALISAGTQIINNGFDDFSLRKVGKDALIGMITGAIAGGIFGGVSKLISKGAIAGKISNLNQAQTNLDDALNMFSKLSASNGTPFATSNYVNSLATALNNYNTAYKSFIFAKTTYSVAFKIAEFTYLGLENVLSNLLSDL